MSSCAREPDFPLLAELRAVMAAATPAAAHAAIAEAARGLGAVSAFGVQAAEIMPGPRGPVVLWRMEGLHFADRRLEDWFARVMQNPGRALIFDEDYAGIAARGGESWLALVADSPAPPARLEKAMREMAGLGAEQLARLRREEEDRRRRGRLDETGAAQAALLRAGADLVWQAGPDGVIRVTEIFHGRDELGRRFDGRALGDVLAGDTSLQALAAAEGALRGLRVTLKGGTEGYTITCCRQAALLRGTVSEASAERLAIDAFTLETVLEGRSREEQLRRETETMMQGLRLLLGDAPFREKLGQLAQALARVIDCDDARLIQQRPGEAPRLVLPGGVALEETPMLGRILAAGDSRAVSVLPARSDEAAYLRGALTMRQGDIALIALTFHSFPDQAERHYLLCRARGTLSNAELGLAERVSLLLGQALLLQADQNRLIHAAKLSALGRMSTSIAHELRQPLNTISIAAQNLELLAVDPATLKEKTARILGQVERACRVMDRMRRFGRRTAGEHHPVALAAIARSARSLMDKAAAEGGIAVDIEVDESLRVFADEMEIEQVLVNLIQNAADAIHETARSGCIRIRAAPDPGHDDRLRLTVEDSGPGFPPAVLKHALDAFFTTKPEGKGTGLGLSIAHAICREHGGRLLLGNGESGGGLVTLVLRRAQSEAQLIAFPERKK